MFVVVEDEFAFELVQFDGLPVEFGGDIGLPVFADFGEFFRDVDLGHDGRIISGGETSQRSWLGKWTLPRLAKAARRGAPILRCSLQATGRALQLVRARCAASGGRRVDC